MTHPTKLDPEQIWQILKDLQKRIEDLEFRMDKIKTPKSNERKHSFEQSPFFDKNKFKAALPGWSKAKLAYYYEAALNYSRSDGKKYCNWASAVKNWDRLNPFREAPSYPTYMPPDTQDIASPEERREILQKFKKLSNKFDLNKFIEDNKQLEKELGDGTIGS